MPKIKPISIKLIIAGGRNFKNAYLLYKECNRINNYFNINQIVAINTIGVSKLADSWAHLHHLPVKRFPYLWRKHQKNTVIKLNKEIMNYGDILLVFWNGKSKRTKRIIKDAYNNYLPVRIINY